VAKLGTALIAPLQGAVEPLVHSQEAVRPTRIRGVGVTDGAILKGERAHTRRLSCVGRQVCASRSGHCIRHRGGGLAAEDVLRRRRVAVIVLGTLPLLFLAKRDGGILLEVAAMG
jgi:hypothetical protein